MDTHVVAEHSMVTARMFAAVAALLAVAVADAQETQAVPPNCRALVEVDRDLFLVDSTGNPVVRFTSDRGYGRSASLSPDGEKVAFLTDGAPDDFRVADRTGNVQSFSPSTARPHGHDADEAQGEGHGKSATPVTAALFGIEWASDSVVRVTRHISPSASRFEFYEFDRRGPARLQAAARPAFGGQCSLIDGHKVACLSDRAILVEDKVVFSESGFEGVQPSETFELALGSAASTHTVPPFDVSVSSLSDGVTLRITLPTGHWEEQRMGDGESMRIALNGEVFGFFPTLVDRVRGVVRVGVKKSASGTWPLSAIAFQPKLGAVVVVKRDSTGNAILALAHGGEREEDGAQPRAGRGWRLFGRAPLPVAETITSIRFLSRSTLFFRTPGVRFGLAELDVARGSHGGGWTVRVGAVRYLPNVLSARVGVGSTATKVRVLDWTCQ